MVGSVYWNVGVLGACQAFNRIISSMLVATSAILGAKLAADPAWATLPMALQFASQTAMAFPASMLMKRYGRRIGFITGCFLGAVGAGLSAWAIINSSFVLFCAGIILLGAFNGFALFYRFAAADTAPAEIRGKAISLVLAGGVVAGFVGPSIAHWSMDWFPNLTFAGTYLAMIGVALIGVITLLFARMPRPTISEWKERGRPLFVIARQPKFLVAVLVGTISYVVMALVMSVTPLAMVNHGMGFGAAAFVVQWHVVGMYAPTFFTGHLAQRFGPVNVILIGAALLAICVLFAVTGIELINFWASMFLLGVGWAFMFVGATTLITEVHDAAERAKTQALNDVIVFGSVSVSVFMAGPVLAGFGWNVLNYATLPLIALAVGLILWLRTRERAVLAAVASH